MSRDPATVLNLDVPIRVRLGERQMAMGDVIALVPGSIIELTKSVEDDLELLVNNKPIGLGRAVKVGENFGIRLTFVGDASRRVEAIRARPASETEEAPQREAPTEEPLSNAA